MEAKADASSLKVRGAIRHGNVDPQVLSASDKDKIQENIVREVLRARDFPEIRFKGSIANQTAPHAVEGNLTLCGNTLPIQLSLSQQGNILVGHLEITPSRWGIKPFKALGGTLRVQDRVLIDVELSAEFQAQGGFNPAIQLTWKPS